MPDKKDLQNVEVLAKAISKAIGDNEAGNRYFDLKRIPLICLSITNIEKNLTDLKEMMEGLPGKFVSKEAFSPVQKIAYGLVGLTMAAVFGAVIALVIK